MPSQVIDKKRKNSFLMTQFQWKLKPISLTKRFRVSLKHNNWLCHDRNTCIRVSHVMVSTCR